METSLKKKVIKGTFWVFISQIVTQFFALVKNIIIARVLSPDDFGLFGIALIVLSLFEVFTQTGFAAALIQKKEDIKDYLDTTFVVNIFRGILLFTLLFFLAPLVSIFFENEAVIPIVRVISFTFLINAFINPGTIYFRKELDFRKQFHWDMSRTITNVIVSLAIIFYLRNVWVLVIAILSSYFVRLIVSYFIHPYKPRFRFERQYASSLFKFGKWVLCSSILIYLITQGDDAFVGKILGITSLGFYRMAYLFSNLPATQITHVISSVTFPVYSKLQDDIPRLREAYLKILQVTAFFVLPIAGLIFVLAPDFTRLFLGEKWMPMVPAMQVLVLWGVLRSIGSTSGPIFLGVGKPEIAPKLQFLQLILLIISIYPLTLLWGILGTSLSVVFAALIPNIMAYYITIKITKCGIYNFTKLIILPALCTLGAILFIFILKMCCFALVISILNFIIFLILYCIVCLGINYLFERFLNYRMKPLFKEIFIVKEC